MEKPSIENDISVRHKKLLCFTGIILAVCLYAYRLFLLLDYAFKYVDNDTAIYWLGTVSYSKGFFPEPFFFGQRYGLMIESVLTVPLQFLHIPVWISVPLVSMLIYTLPFIIVALYTWKRDALTSVLILLLPCLTGLKYDIVTTVPRAFGGSYLIVMIGSLLVISKYKGKPVFTQLWHGIGVFLMMLGVIANLTSATVCCFVICCVILRDFFNGKSFDANFHDHKYIGSLIGLFLGIGLFFGFDSFYNNHPDYDFFPAPALNFSLKSFSENMSEISTIFAGLSPSDNLWFICPALIVLISLFILIVRWKSGWHLPFVMIMCLIGTLLFMTMDKSREFDPEGYLYSQTRLYVFIPYLITMLLCISTFYEKKPVDAAKARPVLYIAVPVLIVLVLLTGITKALTLHNAIKQGNKALTEGDRYLYVKPVEVIIDESEKTKKFCLDNNIQYVVYFMPYDSTSAYTIAALDYDTLTTFNALFERRTWIYNELNEKRSDPLKIYAISYNRSSIITIPPDVSVVQYLENCGFKR